MKIRFAENDDLLSLLELYTFLNNNPMPIIDEHIRNIWTSILNSTTQRIIVGICDGKVVSTCVLMIIQNLTHKQEPYAIIENVVTHGDYRGRGYGSKILEYAMNLAEKEGCYKVSLMTGSKLESTLRFYESSGYNRKDKTAFIKWFKEPIG